jgi:hypothetical protein
VPDGSVFLPWDRNSATFAVSNTYHAVSGWTDPNATLSMPIGAFLWLPSATQISFVGELSSPIACYSYPQGLSVTVLPESVCAFCIVGPCPTWASDGAVFTRWNASRQAWDWEASSFYLVDSQSGYADWFPVTPQLGVAEAALIYMPSAFSARMPYGASTGGGTSAPPVLLRDWQRSGTNGSFRFGAGASTAYTLLASSDLNSWSAVQQANVSPSNGYVNLNVPVPTNGAVFYKLGDVGQLGAPQLFKSSRSGTQFQFQFYGAQGTSYTAQRKTLLTDNVWQNVATVTANGGLVTVTDTTATASTGYYRLQF